MGLLAIRADRKRVTLPIYKPTDHTPPVYKDQSGRIIPTAYFLKNLDELGPQHWQNSLTSDFLLRVISTSEVDLYCNYFNRNNNGSNMAINCSDLNINALQAAKITNYFNVILYNYQQLILSQQQYYNNNNNNNYHSSASSPLSTPLTPLTPLTPTFPTNNDNSNDNKLSSSNFTVTAAGSTVVASEDDDDYYYDDDDEEDEEDENEKTNREETLSSTINNNPSLLLSPPITPMNDSFPQSSPSSSSPSSSSSSQSSSSSSPQPHQQTSHVTTYFWSHTLVLALQSGFFNQLLGPLNTIGERQKLPNILTIPVPYPEVFEPIIHWLYHHDDDAWLDVITIENFHKFYANIKFLKLGKEAYDVLDTFIEETEEVGLDVSINSNAAHILELY